MSQISVSTKGWEDIIVCYLLDVVTNGIGNVDNPKFANLIHTLKGLGAKSPLLSYFLEEDAFNRVKYRMIRGQLVGEPGQARIYISREDEDEYSR